MTIDDKKWFCFFAVSYATAIILVLNVSSLHAGEGELIDRVFSQKSYPNSDERHYKIYVPDSYDGTSKVPMVMVLHGCSQDRNTVFTEFGWDEAADDNGFIVVAADLNDTQCQMDRSCSRYCQCWCYWNSQEIHQGEGEVEDVHQIALEVEKEGKSTGKWNIDPDRRHIVGLSSGGFMANAAAVAHNEYWASAGVHEGGGYAETSLTFSLICSDPRAASGTFRQPKEIAADMRAEMNSDYKTPLMLIHSTNDCSVGHGVERSTTKWGGLTSNREAWLMVNCGSSAPFSITPYETIDCSRDGIACTHNKYCDSPRSLLETVSFEGLTNETDQKKGHYWSGGEADGQFTKEKGPESTQLFWSFFKDHERPITCPSTPPAAPTGLRAIVTTENIVKLEWDQSSEANLVKYYIYRDRRKVDSVTKDDTSYVDTTVESANTYEYHITAVNDDECQSDSSKTVKVAIVGCKEFSNTLDKHVSEGRAYKKEEESDSWWCRIWPWCAKTTVYYAKGSEERLGTNGLTEVTLYTKDGVEFTKESCRDND